MGQSNRQKTQHLKMKALSALVFSAWALPVVALDLGRLQILSGIGEPLRAEIEIAQATAQELSSLRAQVASPKSFSQAGMEFNPGLSGLISTVVTQPNGKSFIQLNGLAPIKENFVDLILETQWSSGQLVKNYALLLNATQDRAATTKPSELASKPVPSGLSPTPESPAPLTSLASTSVVSREFKPLSVEVNSQGVPVYRFAPTQNEPETSIKPVEAASPPIPVAVQAAPAVTEVASVSKAPTPEPVSTDPARVQVKSGDTASRLAMRHLGPNVSLDQMLLALLKANPHAFIQGNVNLIKAGAILKIPSSEDAVQIPQAEARQTVVAQSKEFAKYARGLAERPLLVTSKNSREMQGKVVPDIVPSDSNSPQQDKLTLSKSKVDLDNSEAKLATELESKNAAKQLAALTKNVEEMSALTKEQAKTSSGTGSDAVSSTASAGNVPDAPMKTLLENFQENKSIWTWAGLLLLAALLMLVWLRKKSGKQEEVFSPSYDDVESDQTPAFSDTPSDKMVIPAQMAAIDLELGPAPSPAAPTNSGDASPATLPEKTLDSTNEKKLDLASQLLSKGDHDLARALILSVASTSTGDLKARAIHLLGQIR
jgi:pilus assembly protein FimV